jgi:hypothetical protein
LDQYQYLILIEYYGIGKESGLTMKKMNDWKEYWNEQQQDPSRRREVRQEKAVARRQHHKRNRQQTKRKLNDFIDLDELGFELEEIK